MSVECENSAAVLKAHAPTEAKSPRLAEGKPENPLFEGNLASQLTEL